LREPGGSPISERLREILLDKKNLEMGEMTELLLFAASRAQLVAEIVRPSLARGETVILDRYYDSTTAYQGYGRGIDLEAISHINRVATQGTVPDLTILVDIPVEEIERRKQSAGAAFDRMESAGREFYARVRKGFLAVAASSPERFRVIDGLKTVELIQEEIWNAVRKGKYKE
jgi:dTMP kinase